MENDYFDPETPEEDGKSLLSNLKIPKEKKQGLISNIIEQVAEAIDTKTALKIKEKQVTLKHQYDMEALNKKHEIDLNKHSEMRKTIKLIGVFAFAGFVLLFSFLGLLIYAGLSSSILNVVQGVVTILSIGFGTFQVGKNWNKPKNQ